jgi:hypothetical protein
MGVAGRPALRLFAAGASILFWELALIRWLGSNARLVAYYSNFVLTAAFFGLGVGTLASRHERLRLQRLAFPLIATSVLLGVALAGRFHYNPGSLDEYVWIGAPAGLASVSTAGAIPIWAVLCSAYLVTAAAFVPQGYALGGLFRTLPPLRAYSAEVFGSLVGILLFGLMSLFRLPPAVWFAFGAVLLIPFLEPSRSQVAVAIVCAAIVVAAALPASRRFAWSPYYKLAAEPIDVVYDFQTGAPIKGTHRFGYAVTVNHDFYQMMLDLRAPGENAFLRAARDTYDAPYRDIAALPPGRILVVGAGTGNDVSAALRSTDRLVDAVEIDPSIIDIGRALHAEKPYQNPRVTIINDDARSFFQRTPNKYALVVFGFLDSHTLLSTYTSVRLDNFIYTRESLERVRQLLVPGGQLYVSFASNTPWIHERITNLVTAAFDRPTIVDIRDNGGGVVYHNVNLPAAGDAPPASAAVVEGEIPSDDWPFLYLKSRTIPRHYGGFMAYIIVLGATALLLLPRGKRGVRMPYFLMGAAFFLLETSNVVRLSILFGSTWSVNVLVFSAILVLVLLANLTRARTKRLGLRWVSLLLLVAVVIGYLVPTHALLAIGSPLVRATAAGVIFLGPVYFAGLLFATLIENEPSFYQAYASNVLGAMVGGACEYLSIVVGFKVLVLLTLAIYVAVVLSLRRHLRGGGPDSTVYLSSR